MGVNLPSAESLELTSMGKFVPHVTSPKRKRQEEWAIRGEDAREGRKRTLEKHRVSDSGEEGE